MVVPPLYWVADVTVRTMTGRTVTEFYEAIGERKDRALKAAKKRAQRLLSDFPNHKIHVLVRPAHDGVA